MVYARKVKKRDFDAYYHSLLLFTEKVGDALLFFSPKSVSLARQCADFMGRKSVSLRLYHLRDNLHGPISVTLARVSLAKQPSWAEKVYHLRNNVSLAKQGL